MYTIEKIKNGYVVSQNTLSYYKEFFEDLDGVINYLKGKETPDRTYGNVVPSLVSEAEASLDMVRVYENKDKA